MIDNNFFLKCRWRPCYFHLRCSCCLNRTFNLSWTDFDIFLLIKQSLCKSGEFKLASSGISLGITEEVGRVADFVDFERVLRTGSGSVAGDTTMVAVFWDSGSWNVTAIECRFQRSFSAFAKPTSTAISRGKQEKVNPSGLRIGILNKMYLFVLSIRSPASQVQLAWVVARIFREERLRRFGATWPGTNPITQLNRPRGLALRVMRWSWRPLWDIWC